MAKSLNIQAGILDLVPKLARFLAFAVKLDSNPKDRLQNFCAEIGGKETVVGIGRPLLRALDVAIPGLREFPAKSGPGFSIPSNSQALWCWVRGDDRGEIIHRTNAIIKQLAPEFSCEQVVDSFRYRSGYDLTGYVDGTENPQGEEAVDIAFIRGETAGIVGSSFVATQLWLHDLDYFRSMTQEEQDNIIGRRKMDNEELDDAPPSAHVKRTAQESFTPQAFLLRRSMPWADADRQGLVFLGFTGDLDTFESHLKRMVGEEDGITDGLFRFTRPLSGAYYWCPPVHEGVLDLRAIGM